MLNILCQDFYKLTTQQFILSEYPQAYAKYEFTSRSDTPINNRFIKRVLCKSFKDNIRSKFIGFTEKLKISNLFSSQYEEYIDNFDFNNSKIEVDIDTSSRSLKDLRISAEGPWHEVMMFEIQVLSSISELYHDIFTRPSMEYAYSKNIIEKIKSLPNNIKENIVEFGTRRRVSFHLHNHIFFYIKDDIKGTSNPYFATVHNKPLIGTFPHELPMGISGLHGVKHANKITLDKWDRFYEGQLNTALTDTFTTDYFLKSFDRNLASKYNLRHDSGNWREFLEKVDNHYRNVIDLDPTGKTIVYSDGLKIDESELSNIYEETTRRGFNCIFGIGTAITCPLPYSLNIVMKMTHIKNDKFGEWVPVVKLSDVEGKENGCKKAVDNAKKIIGRNTQ